MFLKKAHNSVKNKWIVTQIELDLCFDIIYQHTKFEFELNAPPLFFEWRGHKNQSYR